jgi:TPP-dependent pyruvate/acetoin dehydrogenase alpha subunit
VKNDLFGEAYLRMLKIRRYEEAVSRLITAGEVAGACQGAATLRPHNRQPA